MELGTKIKRLRLQNNLTQEELADRCELTKGYISQLENELTSPSITTLEDILNALGTTFADFFKDEKEEKVVFTEAEFIEAGERIRIVKVSGPRIVVQKESEQGRPAQS